MCRALERDFNFAQMFSLQRCWLPKGLRPPIITASIGKFSIMTEYLIITSILKIALVLMNGPRHSDLTELRGDAMPAPTLY